MFVWGKTVIHIIDFSNKNDLPQCLVVFFITMSLLSLIRSLLSELSLFGFPLLRKSKGYTLDSGLTPTRSEKRNTEIPLTAPIPLQNHSTGLSAPFQLKCHNDQNIISYFPSDFESLFA